MSISITFLGGAGTVTGSKYLVRHGGQALLVDCGLTEEAAALAERLARQCEDLKLCNTEEICQWMQTPIQ